MNRQHGINNPLFKRKKMFSNHHLFFFFFFLVLQLDGAESQTLTSVVFAFLSSTDAYACVVCITIPVNLVLEYHNCIILWVLFISFTVQHLPRTIYIVLVLWQSMPIFVSKSNQKKTKNISQHKGAPKKKLIDSLTTNLPVIPGSCACTIV